MRVKEVSPQPNWVLFIVADDGRVSSFDVSPYLEYEAFQGFRDPGELVTVANGAYFVAWGRGADLSVDTIEAHWRVIRPGEQSSASHVDHNCCAS